MHSEVHSVALVKLTDMKKQFQQYIFRGDSKYSVAMVDFLGKDVLWNAIECIPNDYYLVIITNMKICLMWVGKLYWRVCLYNCMENNNP